GPPPRPLAEAAQEEHPTHVQGMLLLQGQSILTGEFGIPFQVHHEEAEGLMGTDGGAISFFTGAMRQKRGRVHFGFGQLQPETDGGAAPLIPVIPPNLAVSCLMSFFEGESCRVRHQYRSTPLMEGTRTSRFLRFPCIKRGVRIS